MIEINDFEHKSIIYQDFLSNIKQQKNEILIFKCKKFQDYVLKIDENASSPYIINILFYLHLKMKTSESSLPEIFVKILNEISAGIYQPNINNYTINLEGLKNLFYLKQNKTQQTLKKLYLDSKQLIKTKI